MKVTVDYFTDPLCAWSYVSEPTVREMVKQFGNKVEIRFRSLPTLDSTVGEARPGERHHSPMEMMLDWKHISQKTGAKIDPGLWMEDFPHTSWPSNRAMKASFRQGFDKGATFVSNLRDAIMQHKMNPSDMENLKKIASRSGLNVNQFYDDMTDNAFELEQEVANDKLDAINACVTSTPTLVMQNDEGDKIIIQGTLDFEVVSRSVRSLMGEKVIGAPKGEPAPSI